MKKGHMKRFLITTALEETWGDNKPVLFLGEWCRLYSRQKRWSSMDAVVLPYHWEDRDKFYADYQFLREFYERLLVDVARQLNQIHGVDHGVRYWRILIGPWLAYFIQMLFDRWSSIQQAVSHFDISETIILNGNEDALVPNDMGHCGQLMVGDEWNHYIYAVILEQFTNVPCIRKAYESCTPSSKTNNVSLKVKISEIYAKMASYFVREHDAFLLNTYLPFFSEMKLQKRIGQVPQFWRRVQPVRKSVDWQQRKWALAAHSQTDFEKCAFAMIPKQIPTLYLEGYRQLIEQSRKLPWPKKPKVIFSSCDLWHGTVSMAYTAEKVEEGTPLVYGQHGGVYGTVKFTWAEEHEVAIADRYLTWGWSDPSQPKIIPAGILKSVASLSSKARLKTKLLLVLGSQSRYSYRLDSNPCSSLLLHSFNDSFLFVASLPKFVQNQLLVRLYLHEYGWQEYSRWKDRFPEIKLDPGVSRMKDLLKGTRLAIYTSNSTGYLEAFAGDIPSILFWDPSDNPLRDCVIPYFEELKRAGIFHETPESAANQVAAIWDDVDAWWTSPPVRKALARFKARYCHVADDLLDRVERTLREVMAVSDKKAIQYCDSNGRL